MKQKIWLLIGLLMVPFINSASEYGVGFEDAVDQFSRGRVGDESANESAFAQFEALYQQSKGDPLYLAYLGASEALKGRYAWMPWTKMGHSEAGLAKLDKALQLLGSEQGSDLPRGVPLDLYVTLVCASTYVDMPGFFNVREKGKALLNGIEHDARFGKLPKGFRANLHFAQAVLAKAEDRSGDFKQQLQRAAELDKGGVIGNEALRLLDKGAF